MYEEKFALRLSELRESKKVSAREMSLALGQNASYINRIENQKAFPSMQGFFYICEYLKISPAEFFNEQNSCPEALRSFFKKAQELTPPQIELLDNLIDQMK